MEQLENEDIFYMKQALEEAHQAAEELEVPVGAVIVHDKKIISRGRNHRESLKNSLCHAEIEAIHNACENLQRWCAGAIINSRISRVVYGAFDPKAGSCSSVINLFELPYNHKPEISSGILQDECSQILSNFFKKLRK